MNVFVVTEPENMSNNITVKTKTNDRKMFTKMRKHGNINCIVFSDEQNFCL